MVRIEEHVILGHIALFQSSISKIFLSFLFSLSVVTFTSKRKKFTWQCHWWPDFFCLRLWWMTLWRTWRSRCRNTQHKTSPSLLWCAIYANHIHFEYNDPKMVSKSAMISYLSFYFQFINWISFQMAVLAFIYNCLAMKCIAKQVSAVSIGILKYINGYSFAVKLDRYITKIWCIFRYLVWNMVLFIMRISLDLTLIEYRQEGYAVEWT